MGDSQSQPPFDTPILSLAPLTRPGEDKPPNNTPVSWKLYPKNATDQWVAFENKGLSVHTQTQKSVAVIGIPGFKCGQHTWQVKLKNVCGGFGIGVCLGRNTPGLCVMYPNVSGFRNATVTVELDCETNTVLVKPLGGKNTMLQYCRQVKEVHAYFVLLPSDKQGQMTVVEMDNKRVEDDGYCCIL